jgi:phosphoglycerate dehydrogenase-like enzyme
MPVLYYDMIPYPEAESQLNTRKVKLSALLKSADFVSIHMHQFSATQDLFNADILDSMKPTAFLINSSRSSVVDQAALTHALQEDRIARTYLDMFAPEPLPADQPILKL